MNKFFGVIFGSGRVGESGFVRPRMGSSFSFGMLPWVPPTAIHVCVLRTRKLMLVLTDGGFGRRFGYDDKELFENIGERRDCEMAGFQRDLAALHGGGGGWQDLSHPE